MRIQKRNGTVVLHEKRATIKRCAIDTVPKNEPGNVICVAEIKKTFHQMKIGNW